MTIPPNPERVHIAGPLNWQCTQCGVHGHLVFTGSQKQLLTVIENRHADLAPECPIREGTLTWSRA